MGSKVGILKVAARRVGIPLELYLQKIQSDEKWCYRCKLWKPKANFSTDKTRGDGRKALCKACDYIRKTPGPGKAERREKRGKGLVWCRRCREWKPGNQVYAGLCRPHANEETRRLYGTSKRFRMERRQHAHSRKRNVAPIPPEAQEMLLEEFEGKCAYCMKPATTWDHIIPVARGGETIPSNIVPACTSCNSSKKTKDVFEWLKATGRTPSERLIDRMILADCGLNSR